MKRRTNLMTIAAAMLAVIATAAATGDEADGGGFANALVVHNRGVGGNNSTQGLARFDRDVVALKPDFVLIYFGLNDTLNEKAFVDEPKFIENLDAMIAAAREAKITPVLATIHHVKVDALLKRHDPKVYGEEGPQKKINRYNAAIRKLAADRGVTLADWCKTCDQIAALERKLGEGADSVSDDGVHLTYEGNVRLARCFHAAIRETLRDGQTIVCLGDSVTFGAGSKGAGTATGNTYPAQLRRIKLD